MTSSTSSCSKIAALSVGVAAGFLVADVSAAAAVAVATAAVVAVAVAVAVAVVNSIIHGAHASTHH